MRNLIKISSFFILLILIIQACSAPQERVMQSFNENWKFKKGEQGEESKLTLDDSDWRSLNLPHDWAIEGPFDKKHDARTGGLPISGIAWYRKQFVIDEKHKGNSVFVEFDGIMNNAEIFLNGKSLGKKVMGVDKTTIPAELERKL